MKITVSAGDRAREDRGHRRQFGCSGRLERAAALGPALPSSCHVGSPCAHSCLLVCCYPPPPPPAPRALSPDLSHAVCAVQEDGGVVKEIVKPGTGWEEPEKGDKVQGKQNSLCRQLRQSRQHRGSRGGGGGGGADRPRLGGKCGVSMKVESTQATAAGGDGVTSVVPAASAPPCPALPAVIPSPPLAPAPPLQCTTWAP